MADETTPATTSLDWYVNAENASDPKVKAFAAESRTEAKQLVDDFIGGDTNPFGVPETVVARAVLEVGADLFYRRASKNGTVQLGGAETQLFRISRDPMAAAYPLLRRYLVMGL